MPKDGNIDRKEERMLPHDLDVLLRYLKREVQDGPDPNDTYDPYNYYREGHDSTLLELREGLTKAVTE